MSEMNMREYNVRLIEEYRANGGKLSGQLANSEILLLTTTGAKTGQERITPMGYRLDGDRIIVIAASLLPATCLAEALYPIRYGNAGLAYPPSAQRAPAPP